MPGLLIKAGQTRGARPARYRWPTRNRLLRKFAGWQSAPLIAHPIWCSGAACYCARIGAWSAGKSPSCGPI